MVICAAVSPVKLRRGSGLAILAPWWFDDPTRSVLHPRWSPDGKLISYEGAANELYHYWYKLDS